MCGPSSSEEALAGQETMFSNLLMGEYSSRFGAQSKVLQNLDNLFTPIAEAGPDQQGMGPQELAALRTQSSEGTAAQYAKAERALGNQISAQGGGSAVLPSGASDTLKSQIASAAAAQQSSQDLAITEADYSLGRQNWEKATAGLNALSQEYNPGAIAGEAMNANQGAFGEQNQVQSMKNQEMADIVGGITSLGTSFLTGGLSNLAPKGGGASFGEQVGNFFSGGLQGLQG